jgi:hypothetical protein
MKFRKKLEVIEAVQWTGANLDELRAFVPEQFRNNKIHEPMGLITPEGVLPVCNGDWIIKDAEGEFYLTVPNIFEMIYEKVDG